MYNSSNTKDRQNSGKRARKILVHTTNTATAPVAASGSNDTAVLCDGSKQQHTQGLGVGGRSVSPLEQTRN